MAADIVHQRLDHQQADDKGYHAAHSQHGDFHGGDAHAGEHEFQELNSGGAQHGGDCHEEGKFRAGAAADTQHDGTEDGTAGTGSAGNQTQTLE